MATTRTIDLPSTVERWTGAIAALGLTLGTVCCTDTKPADTDTLAIGILLPFTGTSSGTSANFERAAIYATNRVNQAGGIRGKRLRLVAADTHSSASRSTKAVTTLLDENVVVVIGVESADVAAAVEPMLIGHDVAFMSPLVGSADETLVRC